MNACGHHHVGHIGILGVDKNGEEWYQVSIGGAQGEQRRALGQVIGPSFAAAEMPDVVARLIDTYVELRARGRALRRHGHARRHRAVQGARLCHVVQHSAIRPSSRRQRRRRAPTAARGDLMAALTSSEPAQAARILTRQGSSSTISGQCSTAPKRRAPTDLRCCRSPITSRSRSQRRTACGSRRPTTPRCSTAPGDAAADRGALSVVHRRPRLLDRRLLRAARLPRRVCARSATCCATSCSICGAVGFDPSPCARTRGRKTRGLRSTAFPTAIRARYDALLPAFRRERAAGAVE